MTICTQASKEHDQAKNGTQQQLGVPVIASRVHSTSVKAIAG
jgi:hypothetical protein